LVRDVVYYDIHFGRMKSIIGQNAWFLCQVLCRSLGDMYTRKPTDNTKRRHTCCASLRVRCRTWRTKTTKTTKNWPTLERRALTPKHARV